VRTSTTHRRMLLTAMATAALAFSCVAAASAQTTTTTTTSEPPPGSIVGAPPAGVATLMPSGEALPPPDAPLAVQNAIRAANRIHRKPYFWGGGHRRWKSKGYDCSGAVSYVLHAAGLLSRPLVSGLLASRWGLPGTGSWITVYANRSHTYAVIAGLRFDTSAVGESLRQGSGPRWRTTLRSPAGYAAKYYPGF
jgi:cell wall-associated NlpC family hydrolase